MVLYYYYLYNMHYRILLTLGLTFSVLARAQQILPKVEGWRVHPSFATNNCIEEVEDKIFVGNNTAMYSLIKNNNEIEILSRVNGLSDVNIQFIKYHQSSKTLIIGYDNLNIDLIQDGRVYNLPDVLNKVIIGDKTLNNITVYENDAYLSCSFGIVVIDVLKKRVVDSYTNLGANGSNLIVNDVSVYNGALYASSINGIYRASLSSLNLSDYNYWSLFKASQYSNHIETFQGKLYAVVDSIVQTFDGVNWSVFNGLGIEETNDMRVVNDKLVITLLNQIVIESGNGTIITNGQRNATDCLISKEGDLFYLVPNQYMIKVDGITQELDYLAPPGPFANTATRMNFTDGKLWVAGGQVNGFLVTGGWGPSYNNNKFYRHENNEWFSYKNNTDARIVNSRDFIDVTTHPLSKNTFFASFGSGILELNGNQVVQFYDSTNSSLRPANAGVRGPVNVSGIAFDANNNLWVSNTDAANPLSVKTAEGIWKSFSFTGVETGPIGFITIDDIGQKWIFSTRAKGIYVYNSGSSILDEKDDALKRLTKEAQQGLLPSEGVLCITKDQKGEMWIGTDQGLCIFSNPENVFKAGSNFDARQIVIKTGLVFSNFLGNTPVQCIKVDAANRKWIGTVNGAWLVSSDGYTVIRNFTMSNSPLLSNSIIEIGINDITGEVFFVTEKGIISYIGTATEGGNTHGDVLVYPNPVKSDYTGLIAIRGLVNNAYVKITDISGHLVNETRANGGTATWDGNNFAGKRSATGVYLIYSSNADGTETNVAKILFIN